MYRKRIHKSNHLAPSYNHSLVQDRGSAVRPASRPRILCISGLLLCLFATAACLGPQAEPPKPTRIAAPTFTPTAVVENAQLDPNSVSATKAALAAAQPATVVESGEQPAQNQGGSEQAQPAQPAEPAAAEPTPEPPTPTPEPQNPEALVNIDLINVRGGPGTNYNVVGGANQGDRYAITGKNQAGDWWEVDYNGGKGWLFSQLVTVQNAESVAIAANIPAPPPPTAVPPTPVPPTPVPAAPAEPAAPPSPQYEFNKAVVGRCDPQAGGTWFSGKTYKNGQPVSGYRVAFSYDPNAAPVTNPIPSGPHEGYKNWDQGYYSHIISANEPRAGNWFVWVVDDSGNRISEIANFQTDGASNTCNQAIVDFDSR